MRKQVIIYFLFLFFAYNSFPQDIQNTISKSSDKAESKKTVTKPSTENLLIKGFAEDNLYRVREANESYFKQTYYSRHIIEQPKFNIVKSFQNNIRWGGFWNGNAVVNFNPVMFIQPTDFINIYASHNTSVFVPITSIKENIKPLLIESAAILAIDNSVKYLFYSNRLLQSLIGFAAKTLAINLIRNSQAVSNQIPDFKYYYCLVSIRH